MQDDIIGDLIVPAFAIADDLMLEKLAQKTSVELLLPGTLLLAVFQPREADVLAESARAYFKDTFHRYLEKQSSQAPTHVSGEVAEVILEKPLLMHLRGTKQAELASCQCFMKFLDKRAHSLNQAYTLMSEVFEPSRMSHTGNAFRKYLFNKGDGVWRPLQVLRERQQSANAKERFDTALRKPPNQAL